MLPLCFIPHESNKVKKISCCRCTRARAPNRSSARRGVGVPPLAMKSEPRGKRIEEDADLEEEEDWKKEEKTGRERKEETGC